MKRMWRWLVETMASAVDLDALTALCAPLPEAKPTRMVTPLGTRIAIARDMAFSFVYPHLEADWRAAGATLLPFSPLADEAPDPEADAIYLPGGYPELHAQKLTKAGRFRVAMAAAAATGKTIYGECGGFMVLGREIANARGVAYPMTGLLDLETSFARRKLHLGYRLLEPLDGPLEGPVAAHEFHYATTVRAEGRPMFAARDAEGADLGTMGLVAGSVSGSFAHIIDLGREGGQA